MKRSLFIFFLILYLVFMQGCNITDLTSRISLNTPEESKKPIVKDIVQNASTQLPDKLFKDIVNLEPSSGVEVTNDGGYFAAAAAGRHITNIYWVSPSEFTFRLDNSETSSILRGTIGEAGLKITPKLEVPSGCIYINDELNEGKGSVFISWMKEQNFYWYNNEDLKEFKDVQYYYISPLQNYIILFPGNDKSTPMMIDLKSGKESELPEELNHGWPMYAAGLCFSPGESRLAYEDWPRGAVSILDLKTEKEMALLEEDGNSFVETSWSPNGKQIACLKVDENNPPPELGVDERKPLGNKLVIYDVEKKSFVKEIDGEPYIWSGALWSPDGKNLVVNMVEIESEAKQGVQIKGEPYLLNASTWKMKKLTSEESGTWFKQGTAWSFDSKKVLVDSIDEKGESQIWAAEINMNDELSIDDSEYYIVKNRKSGTVVYEVVKLNYKSIDKFSSKRNLTLSPDEKYALFTIEEDGMEYIIVSPGGSSKS